MPIYHDPDELLKRRQSEDRLAADIIDECRVQLMLKFRFLDMALWRMDIEPERVGAAYPLATDASRVIFDPPRIIARFQSSFEEVVRDYLHLVMHCIFRHPFDKEHDNREAWGLTCDIIAEGAVMDMCGLRFPTEDDAARRAALDELSMLVGGKLLPNKLYALLKGMVQTPDGQQYRGMGRSTLNLWHDLFERDDHFAWPANSTPQRSGDPGESELEPAQLDDENPTDQLDAVRPEAPTQGEEQDGGEDAGATGAGAQAAPEDACEEAEPPEQPEGENAESGEDEGSPADDASEAASTEQPSEPDPDVERERREWEDIAKQVEMNLETFSKEWGEEAGSLMANLAVANRKRYDYTDFLRRFMVVTEEMQLNMEEFDYLYYTYGMDLYGNMPLIEPLEYKETERVRDFVIAIDTSESVSGPLVRRFLGHTFSILKSSQDYATEVNVHIIQCDARVQADLKVSSLRDVDALMESMQVRGFGGTDFRPVFDYVEDLRRKGELTDLKGLIYFTDGLGQFPEHPPDYDTAFVFMDEGGETLPPVPPWAMKLVLDETAINGLE